MTAIVDGLASIGGAAAAWLLTYWLHSTLLLGSAWILSRWVLRREAWREVIWKAALVGGLVTATVSAAASPAWRIQLNVPLPLAPRGEPLEDPNAIIEDEPAHGLDLRNANLSATPSDGASASSGASASAGGVQTEEHSTLRPQPHASSPDVGRAPAFGAVERAIVPSSTENLERSADDAAPTSAVGIDRPQWPAPATLLLLVWILAAAALLGTLALRHVRLHGLLEGRRTLSDGHLPAVLAALRRSTGFWRPVRLTATASVATPLALGRSEICVPERFLHGLGKEEQKAALAHELGHLVRRDPAWNLLAQVLEAVFFFQPLNRIARARIRQSAEFLADAWAVRETGSRLGLARCLAEVADWLSAVEAPDFAGSVAMAEGGSPLMARVRRLLEGEPEAATPSVAGRTAAVAIVALTAGFAPAVSSVAATTSVDTDDPASYSEESTAPVQTVEVVRVPAAGTLRERMRSADALAASAGARAYWLAYVVEGNVRVGEDVAEDTGPQNWPDRGPAIEGLLRVTDEVGPAGSGDLLVLTQAAPRGGEPRVVRLAVRTPGLSIDLQGRPVYWLGRALPEESLEWSQALFSDGAQESTIREAALEVVSRHALPGAREILAEVATSSDASNLREEAVEGLAHHPDDATVDVLERLARTDSNPVVQEEAAETLGEVNNPRATSALEGIVRSSGTSAMKEEALEALVERADTLLAGLLLELALRDPDPSLRIEAVERMAELPAIEGLPLLRRVLTDSDDRDVRVEAVEAIGEIGTEEALAALDVLLTESDREIAIEAAETIGEFAPELAAPRLARIAREHPSPEVRAEALDQLSDLGGSALVGEVLINLALSSTDPDLRLRAVEGMEDLPTEEAVTLLGRVAFESQDPGVQRQAAETLGEVGSTGALQLLDRLAREATNEGVARQAVESMGEFPEDVAGPLLRRIATEHPSARVRREALDQLGGGSGS